MDPVLEPEPLDDILSETPTPEPPTASPVAPVSQPPDLTPATKAPEPAPPPTTPPAPPPTPTMSPVPAPTNWDPAPGPAAPPALPHFAPVAPPPSHGGRPADSRHVSDDEWLRIATMRRGNPELASVGWTLVLIGTALIAATYYWGITYGNLFAPVGIRGDLIGGVLLFLGLIGALGFTFIPKQHRVGLGPDSSDQDVENLVRYTNGQVLLSQILAGVGFALVLLGVIWMAYWLRLAWADDIDLQSNVGGVATATHVIGVPMSLLGLLILFFFLGRLSSARRARNAAVLLWIQRRAGGPRPSSSMPSGVFSNGVTEQQVQDLMKRLDGLMAQLPDAAVTEFSKSNEADTYLKLLGS